MREYISMLFGSKKPGEPTPKCASLWQREGGAFVVYPDGQTEDGVWISMPPYVALPRGTDDSQLERAVIAALHDSVHGLPHPTDFSGRTQPIQRAAGVSSWTKFTKGARTLSIRLEDGHYTITPSRNLGGRKGFLFLPPIDGGHEGQPQGVLATNIRRALDLCE
jgi:hypothetical protein